MKEKNVVANFETGIKKHWVVGLILSAFIAGPAAGKKKRKMRGREAYLR